MKIIEVTTSIIAFLGTNSSPLASPMVFESLGLSKNQRNRGTKMSHRNPIKKKEVMMKMMKYSIH